MQAIGMFQKVFSILLSSVLVFAFIPTFAFADEANGSIGTSTTKELQIEDNANARTNNSNTPENQSSDVDTDNNATQNCNTDMAQSDLYSSGSSANAHSGSLMVDQDASEEVLSNENEANDQANSWRYINGEQIYSYEGTSTEAVNSYAIAPFAAAPGVSSYATWYKSNGTTSYTYKANPDDAGKSISISGVKRVGIDVSYHNGTIDWAKVKNSGVSFAIIRCGYGSDFRNQDDTQFINNVRGAQANGIDIGIYLYSYAMNTIGNDSSATSEAEHVLRLLNEAGLEPSDLAYPIFYDLEESKQLGLGSKKLGELATTFCNVISNAGYEVGIYSNLNWWTNYLTDSAFDNSSWHKWVARYPGSNQATSSGVSGTEMWQFSDCGHVDGISGNVDMNFDYVGSYGSPLVWDSNGLRYLNEDGTYFNGGWKTVAGKKYYFGSDGYAYQYEHWIDGKLYYFKEDRSVYIGWLTWWGTDKRSYFGSDGAAYQHEHWIDGKLYYFKASGKCETYTGWLTWWGTDKRSYFGSDGAAYVGLQQIDDALYYFDPNNRCATAAYEQFVDGKMYYFDPKNEYKAHKGWLQWWGSSDYSYFDFDTGAAVSGEVLIDEVRYIFNEDFKTSLARLP